MFLFKREDKFLRRARKQADRVVALKGEFERLTDEALQAKTAEFRARMQAGESLDDLLPEVFAQVREAARRVLGMEHYYVQILGGIILHNGDIAEMKTGEGKTLVATLPVCLTSRSTNTWRGATANGWGGCTAFWAFRWGSWNATRTSPQSSAPMRRTSPMVRITNSALTICATT